MSRKLWKAETKLGADACTRIMIVHLLFCLGFPIWIVVDALMGGEK